MGIFGIVFVGEEMGWDVQTSAWDPILSCASTRPVQVEGLDGYTGIRSPEAENISHYSPLNCHFHSPITRPIKTNKSKSITQLNFLFSSAYHLPNHRNLFIFQRADFDTVGNGWKKSLDHVEAWLVWSVAGKHECSETRIRCTFAITHTVRPTFRTFGSWVMSAEGTVLNSMKIGRIWGWLMHMWMNACIGQSV